MKRFGKILLIFLFLILLLVGGVLYFFGPVSGKDSPLIFTVSEDQNKLDVVLKLKDQNLIKSSGAFLFVLNIFFGDKKIIPGGYRLNQNMNTWQIVNKITQKPDLVWVVIREGLRKEQIAIILAEKLGWDENKKKQWLEVDTEQDPDYLEGVYFPDTYLLPVEETGTDIAKRMIANFNEKMMLLFPKFAAADIKWTTGVKIASLIQREAGGIADMPIISGVIWNRLDKGMRLEIDATLQYIKGPSTSSGLNGNWWSHVDPVDKKIDSPFNTYMNKGLPPTPIANPGLEAIEAALNPAQTDCLFYLHDVNREIHCSKTYEEHKENIKKYL